ncbi:MAG TPA: aminotransferase class V-fold PLP-dependent enzyme [Dehalococcoidales bacterium]
MIYLDNAATSWPKPPEVLEAMANVLEQAGGNPGRSGHRMSIAAARVVYDAREDIAQLVNCPDPLRVIFTENATYALNLSLYGLLKTGDRVVTSSMEHNSVMRPLRDLEQKGVKLTVVPCASNGTLNLKEFAKAVTKGTRLVAIVHASNVTGTIMPIADIAKIAHRAGALLLVDAAQSAGVLPIDVQAMGIDLLAFTGHKGPLGPTGTGALVIGGNVDTSQITPLARGGTGSQSEKQEQPEFLPDKFESGTPNVIGIAGLGAGIRFVLKKGTASIWEHEKRLIQTLREGLAEIKGVKVYGSPNPDGSVGIASFTVKNKTVSEIGQRLDEEYGILTRVGLHCAPAAHQTIGTFPEGTVRLATSVFTTMDEIQQTLKAIEKVARS